MPLKMQFVTIQNQNDLKVAQTLHINPETVPRSD